jgi:hypothetical protein
MESTFPNVENYIILRDSGSTIKCVLSPLTEVVGPTMNLISRTYHFCERRKYELNVLLEYDIIILQIYGFSIAI